MKKLIKGTWQNLKRKFEEGKSFLSSLIKLKYFNSERDIDSIKGKMFFILGCARSGTTSICRILDMATNAECLMEPDPNFNIESRKNVEAELNNPKEILLDVIPARAYEAIKKGKYYGEKNVTLFAFIEELYDLFDCKFIFMVRDGRDVVQSMHNWHNYLFGNFYRECKDEGDLSPEAKKAISELTIELDASDYSRPRPQKGDHFYEKWPDLSRHEMLCWYWNYVNNYTLNKLEKIPEKKYLIVDYTSPTIESLKKVFEFLEIEGFDQQKIEGMLQKKINSLSDRKGDTCTRRNWRDWTDEEQSQFIEIAGPSMQRLGFWNERASDLFRASKDFGRYWKEDTDIDFYHYIYEDRMPQHEAFMDWVSQRSGKIETVCEVGCGRGIGYAEFFKDKYFTGIDISLDNIEWCKENYTNSKHKWICTDFIVSAPAEEYDLVFCQGTIENVYDMDTLITKMTECCKKFLYITAFKGYFPDLKEHVYKWNPVDKCYENKLSPLRVRSLLEKLGFSKIEIFPQKTQKQDIGFETVIIAAR